MSHFYHLVSREIQQHISTLLLFYLQFIQLILYLTLATTLFNHMQSQVSTREEVYNLILWLLILRLINIFSRNEIFSTVSRIKNKFNIKDRRLLIDEIEEVLKKSLDFTKWSCGILATILVLIANLMFNSFIKGIDIISSNIPVDTFLENFIQSDNFNADFFIELFLTSTACIVGIVLLYYFILQTFTYRKRLVLRILRSCEYDTQINYEKYSLISIIKELFFWDYIKKIL